MPVKPITPTLIKRRIYLQIARFWRTLTASRRALPGFIIIGAQKAGTTSLFKYLRQHPNIVPALKKEIKFFDCNFDKGLAWYRTHFPYSAKLGEQSMTGEASPHYILHPLAPQRIAQTLKAENGASGVKLIALLRDPVARAYSHYQLNVRRGRETLSFEQALDQEEDRLAGMVEKILQGEDIPLYNLLHYSYLAKGVYVDQLQNWFQHFPRQQILVLKSEDFLAHPAQGFYKVQQFLGLPEFDLKHYKQHNLGTYRSTPASEMDPATRQRLEDYFRPHNARLNDLLGEMFYGL